ncbi:MAG: GNAT family N-acetyltransferase [Planctomycetaceae bacterium]
MSMNVVTATSQHCTEWLRLRDAVYTGVDRAFHEQEMTLHLRDKTKECFLAVMESGYACGMIEVSLRNVVDGCLTSPVGYVEGIYVDPEHRGSGLARQLLEQAERWCRLMGCTEIATDAELDNHDAQQFHERMGFKETYRIVEYRKTLQVATNEDKP